IKADKNYFIAYPLLLEEKLVGALGFWCEQPKKSQIEEVSASLADLITIGINRCWAKQAKNSRREGLIFRLANQIRNSLDLDTILGTAVSEIRSLLQVDRCFYLWCWSQQNYPSLTVSHEASDDRLNLAKIGECPPQKLDILAKTVVSNTVLCIDDLGSYAVKEDEEIIALLQELGISSILLLPLKTHAGHLGAIACSNSEGTRVWQNEEVEILQAVVDQLAIAIDQAELFAQARATALAAQTQAQQLQLTLQELKQTQGQLIQHEKMSSLGQMVAGIAHEINNPVNFISGNLSCTSEYAENAIALLKLYQKHYPLPDPEIQQYAEDIDLEFLTEDLPKTIGSMNVGAHRIQEIVLSLRNFSRLDQAEMKPVDIHEGIESTLLILHNRLKAKGHQREIQVIKDFGNLPKVECYAGQLNQVFMNILSNGIDALEMSADESQSNLAVFSDSRLIPMIRIRTELVKDWVRISITDNGLGMSEQTRDRIFDPFFTTKPVGKGTGLGLSISYQIVVEKHGGNFECVSAPGEGSEFIIEIPVTPPPENRRG
ncbi:MAG: ATP-binding protein, partial [Oscillatoria sp. PMC 1076.18]|nr:ATP-binding protein [Oscillatoria sp. PMC 1076.18]